MYLCRHANGRVKDYVEKAITLGFDSIGMSDHAPFEILKDRSVRMYPDELEIYFQELDEATKMLGNQIVIHRGLEIEYLEGHDETYQSYLEQLDYLALGQHYIPDEFSVNGLKSSYTLNEPRHLEVYKDTVIKAMESGWFAFLCHPDLMLYGYPSFDGTAKKVSEEIICAAKRLDIPLEINCNGIRKKKRFIDGVWEYAYPRKAFWEIVKQQEARVIISADAHEVEHLDDEAIDLAYRFAEDIGIKVEEVIELKPKH